MKNKLNVRILVCCHKKDVMATQDPYMPIHVGKALHPELDLGIQGDNTGDNISDKNGSYCELTGMYWAWKNLKDVDIIGLCHYRRYFDIESPRSLNKEPIIRKDIPFISIPNLQKILDKYDIILPGKSYFCDSLWDAYAIGHNCLDMKVVEDVISQIYPKYINAFKYIMKENNSYCPCNMLICTKSRFDDYCSWLFAIMTKVEQRIDISNYDCYQKRVFGFISERLLNVYVYHNRLNVCHRPIASMVEGKTPSLTKQKFHRLKSAICFYLKNE